MSAVPHLAFLKEPTNLVAGQSIPSLPVALLDTNSQPVIADHSTVTLSLVTAPDGASFNGRPTISAKNGGVTFKKITFFVAGTYVLQASDNGYLPDQTISFTVSPAATKQVLIAPLDSGPPVANQHFNMRVFAVDKYGNFATNENTPVTISLLKNRANAVIHGQFIQQLYAGFATFSNISISAPGLFTVKATDRNLKAGIIKLLINEPNT